MSMKPCVRLGYPSNRLAPDGEDASRQLLAAAKLINRYNSSLRHPRHRDGLHVRRDLIAVLGLDHSFVGFAAMNVHPQHLHPRCCRALFHFSESGLQRAAHCSASRASRRRSNSSTSKARRCVSSKDATAVASPGVIAPAKTASSTVPIALRES